MYEYGFLEANDRVIVKQLWKFPVPTAHEVKLLLDHFEDYSKAKVGLGLIAVSALRPIELTRLTWQRFQVNEDGMVASFFHKVNKPAGRQTKNGRNYHEKEIRKPVLKWSRWLSEQVSGYARTAPRLECGSLFPWRQTTSVSKYISNLRKQVKNGELDSRYDCFLDKNSYTAAGPSQPIPFRINCYSLRRFCMTFHFYTTFGMDPVATAKFFGHSEAATTLGHYIQPKEAIGLSQEMIDSGVTFDEFVHLRGKKQMRLVDFDPEWESRFRARGQTVLAEFGSDEIILDY